LILDIVLHGKPDIDSRPQYFTPFDQHIGSVVNKSFQLELLTLNGITDEKLKLFSKKNENNYKDYTFFPLSGNNKKDTIWVFNKKNSEAC